ncbi:hypothetical protein B0H13DRAFT_2333728 [Mycena leptocephala]|nr:hypothetical protein B0H13DRAFT_2333728 [Mycena leptocephala]
MIGCSPLSLSLHSTRVLGVVADYISRIPIYLNLFAMCVGFIVSIAQSLGWLPCPLVLSRRRAARPSPRPIPLPASHISPAEPGAHVEQEGQAPGNDIEAATQSPPVQPRMMQPAEQESLEKMELRAALTSPVARKLWSLVCYLWLALAVSFASDLLHPEAREPPVDWEDHRVGALCNIATCRLVMEWMLYDLKVTDDPEKQYADRNEVVGAVDEAGSFSKGGAEEAGENGMPEEQV